jgi:hypothetical protein
MTIGKVIMNGLGLRNTGLILYANPESVRDSAFIMADKTPSLR